MSSNRLKSWIAAVALGPIAQLGCFAQQHPFTHHVPETVQSGAAESTGHLGATQTMRLTLTLPLRNQTELENFIQAVSDPSSPSYRQFLTVEEFTDQYGPTQQDYDAVVHFAETNHLKVVGSSRNRLNLDVEGSVSHIEHAFNVQINNYRHPTENRMFYAPDREPTVDLQVRLWHISGLDNYSIPQPMLSKRADDQPSGDPNATTGSGPGASFLGSDMRAAYYGGTTLTGSGQSLGLLEFAGVDLDDVNTYYTNIHQTNNVPITLLSTDNGTTSTTCVDSGRNKCDDTEQVLDITQALGMAPGLSSLVVYIGGSDSSVFNAMATANPLNAQLSCSWGWRPADPSTDDPYFMEFAAQGQSLFVASGDAGEWSSKNYPYPSEDPYITSVGGTDLQTSSPAGPWSSETGWADSGGGISPDGLLIPSWQVAAATSCPLCSTSYRNGPDVAANANFTFYVCADQTTCTSNHWGGTSFAAPMWAGYTALVNQQAVSQGQGTLGFVNPALYTLAAQSGYASEFHDIVTGNNGYAAGTGFDLVTGLGSPNGSALINALVTVNGAATMTSPTPGSTLTGSNVTFNWTTSVKATYYSVWVGTTGAGSNDIDYPQAITAASTSMTFTNIPTNAQTLYVRLWSYINNQWQYNDYTYTASGSPAGATMTSPVSGSTLPGAAVTFHWTAATNATYYSVWLGTTGVGSNNVDYPQAITAASTSMTFSNLPTNAQTIYARLWWYVNNQWQYTDYTYTASGSPIPAAMISPAPGSMLPGATATFTWSPATNATYYSVWVGTTGPGSNDIDYPPAITSPTTSMTFSNLPTTGQTLYVRLWSYINNQWQYTDYTYTAF